MKIAKYAWAIVLHGNLQTSTGRGPSRKYPTNTWRGASHKAGASIKEAQTLARHATPELNMNAYGRVRQDRLSEIAEAVGEAVSLVHENAVCRIKPAGGLRDNDASPFATNILRQDKMVEAVGIEPTSCSGLAKASTRIVRHQILAVSAPADRHTDGAARLSFAFNPPGEGHSGYPAV